MTFAGRVAIDESDFRSIEAAARALSEALGEAIQHALAERGRAVVAVSGGRTPRLVFERLREAPVDWSRVAITLVDERWVPPWHAESNERLVRSHLMSGNGAAARFVPLYGGEETPEAGRRACEKRLESLDLPFDAVYLGMGSDGHVASLFPGDPAVHVDDARCVAVAPNAGRMGRMSMTPSLILNARRVYLLFDGPEKQAAYAKACRAGPAGEIPLRLVLRQENTPVSVYRAP